MAEKEAEQAMKLAPNDTGMIITLAYLKFAIGNYEEGLELSKKAVRLHPFPPRPQLFAIAIGYYFTEQYDKAKDSCRSTLKQYPESLGFRALLILSHMALGQEMEARNEAEKLLGINSKFSAKAWANRMFSTYKDPKIKTHLVDRLTAAGLK